MIRVEQGKVLQVQDVRPGMMELVVKVGELEERAILYTGLSAPVIPGQTVLLNTTAVRLSLGSGGYHFVLPIGFKLPSANGSTASGGQLPSPAEPVAQMSSSTEPGEGRDRTAITDADRAAGTKERNLGHIMKMRYTPQQVRVLSCEESDHPFSKRLADRESIEGMAVAAAELHSMLPAIAASFAYELRERGHLPRIVYVMTDGAALPIAFSKTVAELKEKGLLAGTITVGHAFGGDLEAVNLYSGLLAAKHVLNAELTIVTMGPGIVGTGSRYGHTGIEQGQIVNATASLQGTSLVCPRISFTDSRTRHQGISHHTLTVLEQVALARSIVPIPLLPPEQMVFLNEQLQTHDLFRKHHILFEDGQVINQAVDYFKVNLSTMGRGLAEEQAFFMAAGATGKTAARLVTEPGCFSVADDAS